MRGCGHQYEIWFAVAPDPGRTLYMMAGGRDRADWGQNLRRDPAVAIRVGEETTRARARVVEPGSPEDAVARRALCGKYQGWREGQPLSEWGRTALEVTSDE